MPPSTPVTHVCATCGSDRIKLDAWAAWAVETQSWELASTLQMAFCEDCDGETSLHRRPLAAADPPAGPEDSSCAPRAL